MRLYLFHCLDGDDGARLRLEHRDAHLAYVASHIGDYAVAGPLKTDGVPVGSVLVIKGADEAAARARLGDDPYFLAGLWAEVGGTNLPLWPESGSAGRRGYAKGA